MRAMPDFDFERFVRIPRLSGLRVSPSGDRLVVSVASPDPDGKRFASAAWEVDPAGQRPPRRLTRSGPGEGSLAFAHDGTLLFTSSRPDPEATEDRAQALKDVTALWALPSGGGESRVIAAPHGGVGAVRAAAAAGVVVFKAGVHPGADLPADEERETARKKAGVQAMLFDSYPIRYWDHYLGPRESHLFAGELPGDPEARMGEPRDLTPDAGKALLDMDFDVTPDGSTIVTGWRREGTDLTRPAADLVAIDRVSGERRTIARSDGWHSGVRVSPDGRSAASIRTLNGTPERAEQPMLWLADITTGEGRALVEDFGQLWPHDLSWSPDGSAVLGTADDHGRVVVFGVGIEDGVPRVIATDGAFHDLAMADDGGMYALRSSLVQPPGPVRLEQDGSWVSLPFPGLGPDELEVPGVAERLSATAGDGTPVESWLVLPPSASPEAPAPLVVFIHGGPVGSWTGWHWRWTPHLLAARGYAVLMPDPAISTGYGQAFVDRGWGRWGKEPYTDLLAAVDGALERPDLDGSRTAAMGGSFGGYMANWVAGHTDRFRAIVTHASLWELRGFHGTTDDGPWWETEFGDPYVDDSRYQEASPHRFVDRIRTPMLVIHGELDHRVPISEALRLWTDLRRHGVPSRFLYFPDENHWVLKPQNARLWYATVLAFLDEHVLGRPWKRPDLV
jgi:dipeptidyl aminopeptidase/acylaminoacyl peptidase